MVAKGDKDALVLVMESVRNEELVVRPKVRQESSRSPGEPANGKSVYSHVVQSLTPSGHGVCRPAWQLGLSLKTKDHY